jgi:hypothetical protein
MLLHTPGHRNKACRNFPCHAIVSALWSGAMLLHMVALVSHRSHLSIADIVQEVFELGECVGILVEPAIVLHSHPEL